MSSRLTTAFVLMIATLGAAPRAAQFTLCDRSNPGSSAIGGRVSDAKTGEALAWRDRQDVRVADGPLRRDERPNPDGRYEFAGIADGEFTIVASSDTHGRACHGATDLYQVQCVAVAVVRDQQLSGIDFRMPESAAISGIVVDHEGRGVAGARVMTHVRPAAWKPIRGSRTRRPVPAHERDAGREPRRRWSRRQRLVSPSRRRRSTPITASSCQSSRASECPESPSPCHVSRSAKSRHGCHRRQRVSTAWW